MNIISITDIHGKAHIPGPVADLVADADLVLLTGDITHFGHQSDAITVISAFSALNEQIMCVAGNCDHPEIGRYLSRQELNLHGRVIVKDGIAIAGLGGSLITPFGTPYEFSEADYQAILGDLKSALPAGLPVVFVSHQPPHHTACDIIGTGEHVGSVAVREFIETVQPTVCFTGHIHESAGVDHIGNTAIINPGPFSDGGVALFDTDKGSPSAQIYGYVS